MQLSKLIGKRFKEKPSETKLKSHELLIRGGYVRQLANGIFSYLPPAKKAMQKIEQIIREEMNAIDGQEVEMPLVQPIDLWEESGRAQAINHELARFKDRNNHGMVLAMTHEESSLALVRNEISSYKDFPFMVYQFGKKFRDEARSRGGLIRVREFTMKDAYSFHTSQSDLEKYYAKAARAYSRIFARAGIPGTIAVKSDNGIMGGKISHEYMLLTPSGEDTIIMCPACGYQSNKEVATSVIVPKHAHETEKPLEKVSTPNAKTIEDVAKFLAIPATQTVKAVFYRPATEGGKLVVVMIRGDIDVNESKLGKILRAVPEFAGDAEILAAGAVPGYGSGYGLTNVQLIVDHSVAAEKNLVVGANQEGFHLAGFNLKRDMPGIETVDIAGVMEGDLCPHCKQPISLQRGIEVGNIFQLGTKYTDSMKMTYMDESGAHKTPTMGCYGIGVGRLLGSVMEACNDDKGPIFNAAIAPWTVSIASLFKDNEADVMKISQNLYKKLSRKGIDVAWDDRNVSPGEKFADIDLLGVPLQLVVSTRNLAQGQIEWKERGTQNKGFVKIDEAVPFVKNWIKTKNKEILATAKAVKPLPKSEYKA